MSFRKGRWDMFGALRGAQAAGDHRLAAELMEAIVRTKKDLRAVRWHAIGQRVRPGDMPLREVIPAQYWDFLQFDAATRTASGGGVQYVAVEIMEGPQPKKLDHEDGITARLRDVFRQLEARDGKPPSQRAVARESGHDRGAVRARWNLISR